MSAALRLLSPRQEVILPTFDLGYVVEQMNTDSTYTDWSAGRLEKAATEYREFLALCRSFPERSLGISRDADKVWHRHVLNTRRYMADCQSYFGYYFHHTPESGVQENADAQQETNRLYLEAFGFPREGHVESTCTGSGCQNNG